MFFLPWNFVIQRDNRPSNSMPVLAGVTAAVLLLSGCVRTPHWPPADTIEWARYTSARDGYAVDYPALCDVDEHDGGVIFRFEGGPIVSISHAGEEEARGRGLWAGHDAAGETTLGGRQGMRYRYTHYDGPFGMHTTSHVVPHRGTFLAVEFRTDDEETGPVQEHILRSFAFTGGGGP